MRPIHNFNGTLVNLSLKSICKDSASFRQYKIKKHKFLFLKIKRIISFHFPKRNS